MIPPPKQLVLEVSSVCQLSCPQCFVGLKWTHRSHLMEMDLFNKVADEAQEFIRHCYLHNWGEPTLNKHLPEMIQRMKAFATIDIATHGLGLTEKMADAIAECDTVSVSIDGIDQEIYSKYRVGGNLDEAMRGLRLLISKCPRKVNWTFVVFRENEHQLAQAQQIADEIGANIGFKPPVWWDKSKMDASMPTDEKFQRYRLVDGRWILKADRLSCREFWETAYVSPSGDMTTCCYDGRNQYVVGNVWDRTILEVWNAEPYQQMRRNHLRGQLNPLCEHSCNLPS